MGLTRKNWNGDLAQRESFMILDRSQVLGVGGMTEINMSFHCEPPHDLISQLKISFMLVYQVLLFEHMVSALQWKFF